jgi:glycosyltransferase involved in cell wall biosynthesis
VTDAQGALRVLVIIDSLTHGGAELLLTDFVGAAGAAGIEPHVAYLGERDGSPAAGRLRDQGVEPACVPIEGLVHPRSLARLRRHVSEVAPDLVHTHLAYADFMGGLAARSLGVPVVSTVHVMDWEARGTRERARRRLIAATRRRIAARVVTVSDAAREALLAVGLDRPGHVETIHNGVAAVPAAGAGAALRAELGIDPDALVVAQVAVLRPGKGHAVAAEAVARLQASHPKLALVVAGDGPARADVERALAALGDAAVMLGHRDDVMAVLDAADVLLHPSEIDALPTVVMEAMAASVPVVATRVGGVPELVDDGDSGVLVTAPASAESLAGALAPLLSDAGLRSRMGTAGRARYEREFTAESWARRSRALYDDVLEGRRRR